MEAWNAGERDKKSNSKSEQNLITELERQREIARAVGVIATRFERHEIRGWEDEGLCTTGVDPAIFEKKEHLEMARKYCGSCSVNRQCDRAASSAPKKNGGAGGVVWAGKRRGRE